MDTEKKQGTTPNDDDITRGLRPLVHGPQPLRERVTFEEHVEEDLANMPEAWVS